MSCLLVLALAVRADPQVAAPPPTTPPPAPRTDLAFDGVWTVVYVENVGRPVNMDPSLPIRNGTVTINIGQPVTYRLDIGPGHTVRLLPATADVPGGTVAASGAPGSTVAPVPTTTPPVPPPPPVVTAPGATGVGSGEISSPANGPRTGASATTATPTVPSTGTVAGSGTAAGTSATPTTAVSAAIPRPPAAPPGTLEGTFILSQEYLCLSVSPIAAAPAATTPGPAPASAAPGSPVGGIRQDAFVLILKRNPPR
jgi:hypothetical protein